MRSKWLLAIIILSAVIVAPDLLLGQKKSGGPVSLSVRQKFDIEFSNLIKNIKKTKPLNEKLELNVKFLKSIKSLRTQNPIQMIEDEIYMDNVVGALEEFPNAQHFKIESCNDYKDRVIYLYEPRSGGKPRTRALTQAIDVLNSICTK